MRTGCGPKGGGERGRSHGADCLLTMQMTYDSLGTPPPGLGKWGMGLLGGCEILTSSAF